MTSIKAQLCAIQLVCCGQAKDTALVRAIVISGAYPVKSDKTEGPDKARRPEKTGIAEYSRKDPNKRVAAQLAPKINSSDFSVGQHAHGHRMRDPQKCAKW